METVASTVDQVDIKDTCITPDMVDLVDKEDYIYYYLDSEVTKPDIVDRYTPEDFTIFFNHGKNKKERMIYPVEGPYEEKEEEAYEKLLELFEAEGGVPEQMDKRRCMRFLVTNNLKPKNALKNIKSHLEWRKETKPMVLGDIHKKMLDEGYIYIHGRDRSLRPICCANLGVINKLNCEVNDGVFMNWFLCFYLIENFLCKGKVENWIFVADYCGLSLAKLPTKTLKKIMTEAQEHLKCRIRMFFYFNVTFGLRAIYTMVSPFLDKIIKHKTVMKGGSTDDKFLSMAHPSQIEEKFGGEAPNVTQFWPPYCPSNEYDVAESSLTG
ncbi:unnamed protein product [Moneuplotes crassus]|uniref:CRAL-TRIO domain-containing protein n=1 Tax=Euplotes crassus TaxID=5936 RepID=A0AAD1XJB3_EUPCR|nr:unnamed protein product [Moneuplotes crassus]